MMTNNQLNELFLRIGEELDISEHLFERAEKSYQALGNYINNNCDCSVTVYTQGSFRLGTVIKPISDEDQYDLDLVTEITGSTNMSAKVLKHKIGDILQGSERYMSMLEEKKRCWRIEYADEAQFHMDITPARSVKNSVAISVTHKNDNDIYSYTMSNPVGYSEWFENRKRVNIEIKRDGVFEASSVEPVKIKENEVKLPLQRAIQILKRHRDILFENDPDVKPISIIITTLSAQAYCGEVGVFDALKKIIETMPLFIKFENGNYYVLNPSNPDENFADKWNIEPVKVKSFYYWLEKAKNDITAIAPMILDDYSKLEKSLGEVVVRRAIADVNPIKHDSELPEYEFSNPKIVNALSVSHRQKPPFKLPRYPRLGIMAMVNQDGVTHSYQNNDPAIPKNCSIDFRLIVSPNLLKGNYTVKWQVVNTGDEARNASGLRGGFETEVNSIKRHESTMYRGTHYVQAYLLKGGKCIAMSGEFIVNIE